MNKNSLLNRGIALVVVVLFIGLAFAPTFSSAVSPSTTIIYDGDLSGYVKDTNMEPIEGALVRVHFHETYEEDYTDSSGYYHVTNIPICYCLKNVTASKEDYITEWVLLAIGEDTTYDFVLERDDSNLVEITTEVCGLPGYKPQTVKLTQEEAKEVDILFGEIRERLNRVKTEEEAMKIYDEAIVELNKYGLLGDCCIKQIQNLITGRYQNLRELPFLEKKSTKVQATEEEINNFLCLMVGQTTNTFFQIWLSAAILMGSIPLQLLTSVFLSYYNSIFFQLYHPSFYFFFQIWEVSLED